MSGLLESCRKLFGTDNLYDVLKVKKKASKQELKKGYHKVSLAVHPDRVKEGDKNTATKKFQALGKVYSILSDKEKRAVYDETGEIDEKNDITQERDWYDYWRLLFAKVSVKDIEDYEKKYKGSKEEVNDLKSAYLEHKGDMDLILDSVLCASLEDEERFRNILQGLIDKDKLPDFKAFTKEPKTKKSKRAQKAAGEAVEAKKAAKELGANNSLQAMIKRSQASRAKAADEFFAQLEAKYADCEDEEDEVLPPKKSKPGTSKKKSRT